MPTVPKSLRKEKRDDAQRLVIPGQLHFYANIDVCLCCTGSFFPPGSLSTTNVPRERGEKQGEKTIKTAFVYGRVTDSLIMWCNVCEISRTWTRCFSIFLSSPFVFRAQLSMSGDTSQHRDVRVYVRAWDARKSFSRAELPNKLLSVCILIDSLLQDATK